MHSASRVLHSAPRQPTRLLRTALPKSALDILTIQRQKRTSSGPKRNPISPQASLLAPPRSPTFASVAFRSRRWTSYAIAVRGPTGANVAYTSAIRPAVADWHVASVSPRRSAGWYALPGTSPGSHWSLRSCFSVSPKRLPMPIEMLSTTDVRLYESNPRQNGAAVDAVAASIRQFGFYQPIVVDAEGVIICGHTRYKAAQKLGLNQAGKAVDSRATAVRAPQHGPAACGSARVNPTRPPTPHRPSGSFLATRPPAVFPAIAGALHIVLPSTMRFITD